MTEGALAERLKEAQARERAGQAHGETGPLLRAALETARRQLLAEVTRGDVMAARFSRLLDEAVSAVGAGAATSLPAKGRLAIAATGGYGRGQLAPYSDIDLLILHAGLEEASLKSAVDAVLYPLWDAGLKVGHAVHTPASAAKFAAGDMTGLTAFLDARRLVGDAKLYKEFADRFDAVRKRMKTRFVNAKRTEQELRHERSAQSRYLAEPDLKDGKGGLRDIHVIGWIHKELTGKPIDASARRGGLMKADDVESLRKAERFLLSVRSHLHDLRGRADEKLSFDIQPRLAERLGYADRPDASAAERMMKHYFLTAMEIGRLTRVFWAAVEEQNANLLQRAPALLPKALAEDEAGARVNLRIHNGRLDFAQARRAKTAPVDLFRYFRAFAKRPDIDFHPDALALIRSSVRSVGADARRDPAIARLFVASLVDAKDPLKLLRVMNETGLLGRFIPSLGQIAGKIEYGLYRRFSLDEHVFQAIDALSRIRSGDLAAEHPIAASILKRAIKPSLFYVALLLSETEASLKEPEKSDAASLIERTARRLGFDDAEAAAIAFAAARPLLMARLAERRDLSETRAIESFAGEVGDPMRLDLLLVLTVCQLRTLGPGAIDAGTRRQVSALYEGAQAFLDGGEKGLARQRARAAAAAREEAEEALSDWPAAERDAVIDRLPQEFVSALDAATFARAASLVRSADGAGVVANLRDHAIEAIVYAPDRPALLSDLAGAVAGAGGSVRAVRAATLDDGSILDIFLIDRPDDAESAPDLVRRIHAALLDAATAKPQRTPTIGRRLGDRRAVFAVAPTVRFDQNASDLSLVVEAEGRDRPGLLHQLTAAIAAEGAVICSAHVATYGERAVDAFYLRDEGGAKIVDPARIAALDAALLKVLASDSAAPKRV